MTDRFPLLFRTLCLFLLPAILLSCDPGERIPVDVTVRGSVLGHDGEPLSGIAIEAEGRSAVTGPDGSFELSALSTGDVRFTLTGEKGIGRTVAGVGAESSDAELELVYPVVTEIVLLHDNDLHFNFNHRESFREKIDAVRSRYRNVWLLNAGDTFVRHAHRWPDPDTSYYRRNSREIIELMNRTGYDLGVPGNHEIDYVGPWTGDALRQADFPMIAANIDIATGNLPLFDPYHILETENGLLVAVLGLSTVNFDKPGVTARSPDSTVRAYLNLAAESDLFVILSHIGVNSDRQLAEEFPVIDVIVGGHSHTLLEEAETVNGVLIGHAGGPPPEHARDPNWPKYLGKIRLVLHNDRVIEKSGRVKTIGVVEPVE